MTAPSFSAPPRHILITGASSGIGAALALEYAAPTATLSLTGRDAARLAQIVDACRARGAAVDAAQIDAADQSVMAAWMLKRDAEKPLDLVIANAGVSGGTSGADAADRTRRIFAVNLDGVLNTVLPILPAMQARKRGHIALMSSLASFRGIGAEPAYSASKAAVRVYGEALRNIVAADGIDVTVICPGWVVSRITDLNTFPMPFLMSTEKGARIIRRGLDRRHTRIAFPWPTFAAVWLLAALPDRLAAAITRRTADGG